MDLERGFAINPAQTDSWRMILALAYQSLGVVYGDLSISPLYVYRNTFEEDIEHSDTNEEIFGVLSFVFWTLTLIPLLKYVFIVLKADDNGEGGTFALYSLICRHAKVSSLPNGQAADEELSNYKKTDTSLQAASSFSARLKSMLEKHSVLQRCLLVLALIGTCMVIGDGVLTPAISDVEVPVSCVILIALFALQHYGTHRVGFLFAPVVLTWLICISSIGLYNIIHWNPYIYQALSPHHMFNFLKKTQREGWMSLGGILLCITGHFSQLSIKIAFTALVYPSLILAYMGQAAYLSQHHFMKSECAVGFYVSVPEKLRWPVLVIAVLAAMVGGQAIITGTFSIIKQCSALGCFPRVKIVHTSSKIHGRIYIPEINWILMLLCLSVTVGFRDTKRMGNASGLAVITVMLVTTCLMSVVIVLCWHRSVLLATTFVFVFGAIEALFFSASLVKFLEGAWVPVALSLVFLAVMYVWHYGTVKKYEYDVENKVSIDWLLTLGPSLGIVRVSGIGVVHTELVSGIPTIFSHFVTNLPAFHRILIFLCIKSIPVPHVGPEERFLIGRIGPFDYRLYRVIVRYGYHDVHSDDVGFENDLICSVAEFIRTGSKGEAMVVIAVPSADPLSLCARGETREMGEVSMSAPEILSPVRSGKVSFVVSEAGGGTAVAVELEELVDAREVGITYILGHSYVRAKKGSGFLRRATIDFGYDVLRRNSRGPGLAFDIPHASTLEVGMVCHV